jgi:light-regulated signal transduction histidine kinase (bacteriophytochrome)
MPTFTGIHVLDTRPSTTDLPRSHTYRREAALERRVAALTTELATLEHSSSSVVHALAEPLSIISGYVDLLDRTVASSLDPLSQQALGAIERAVATIQSRVHCWRELNRASAVALTPEVVAIDDVLDVAIAALAPRIDGAHARVEREALPAVLVDRSALELTFHALLRNILALGAHATTIRVSAARACDGWRLTFSTDAPAGVRSAWEQLLEPLASDAEGQAGLAACARLLRRHGGSVDVGAAEDGGVQLYVTLPDVPSC